MLPQFPKFKRLGIRDQKNIDAIVHTLAPYSDFNFTSLLSWDFEKKTYISLLHNNLVIKLVDYMTKEERITLIGTHRITQSCKEILEYAHAHKLPKQLSLIPEELVHTLKNDRNNTDVPFSIKKDVDNFDYIYSITDMLELKGTKFHTKRKSIKRFKETHGENIHIRMMDVSSQETTKQILHVFKGWQKIKHQSRIHIRNELTALKRLLSFAPKLPVHILGMFIHDKLCGFIVCEVLPGNYGVMHFGKTNILATGAFEYLIYQSAEFLHSQGCEHLNLQQDLAIENLRKTKLSWRPTSFLKKYTVSQTTRDLQMGIASPAPEHTHQHP